MERPNEHRFGQIAVFVGCGVVLALLGAGIAVALGRAFPFVVLAALGLAAAAAWARRRARARAVQRFRAERPGKDLLLVYTDSAQWRPYIEAHWLPRWGARAAVLNRSAPWTESQPEAALWRAAASAREHTPLAVVVPPRGGVTVVRLHRAFRDFNRGREARLRAAEAKLRAALDASEGAG